MFAYIYSLTPPYVKSDEKVSYDTCVVVVGVEDIVVLVSVLVSVSVVVWWKSRFIAIPPSSVCAQFHSWYDFPYGSVQHTEPHSDSCLGAMGGACGTQATVPPEASAPKVTSKAGKNDSGLAKTVPTSSGGLLS